LPRGDRAENLRRAIACYEAALRVRIEVDFPADWAMTQNNLGIAYCNMPTGDRGENLRQAIACYEAALRVSTETDFPRQWADTQFNLGLTYKDLADLNKDRSAISSAVTCLEAAILGYELVGLSLKADETRQRAEQLRQAMTDPQTPD
jgi:tetratricopeptide (TPR) repeat protein